MKRYKTLLLFMGFALAGTAGERKPVTDDQKDFVDSFVMRDRVVFAEIDESGQKHWEVVGSSAEASSENIVRIHDVAATITQDDGEEIIVLTKRADVDRKTREMSTDLYVEIIAGDRYITGTGMHVDPAKKKYQLFKDVQVVFSRKGNEMGLGALDGAL